MPDQEERTLPPWTEELKHRYLRGEALQFVLHGNVTDLVVSGDRFIRMSDFLSEVLLAPSKDVVIQYNVATGVRFSKKRANVPGLDELLVMREAEKILPALEQVLHAVDKVAIVIDYAEMVAPAGDPNFFSAADRQTVVTLHRWSFSPAIERADSVVLVVTENLSELNQKLVSNPTTAIIKIPMPDEGERKKAIKATLANIEPRWLDQLAEVTAGLKIVQIRALLSGESATGDHDAVLDRSFDRKREIIERECFGLIEFVDPSHDFSVVGGIEEAKKELVQIAEN